jgi:ferritin-like protein
MSSETLHENPDDLGSDVIDVHRAIVSVMEELEAVDWYNQRAKATANPELRAILEHNRDEEKEHASMVLEWLRRADPVLGRHFGTYLFTEGQITEIEAEAEHGGGRADSTVMDGDGSLGIGSLRRVGQ